MLALDGTYNQVYILLFSIIMILSEQTADETEKKC
jgi:hypothetical protein